MREDVREANVVLAKCRKSHRMYGIRIERRMNNVWYCTWAFPISETSASNEGYGSTMISGRVETAPEYPGCPYCGARGWVNCGNCGKLTCWGNDEKYFTCTWCGNSGEVTAAETFDLQGGGY